MMAGLMVIFLFIAAISLIDIARKEDEVESLKNQMADIEDQSKEIADLKNQVEILKDQAEELREGREELEEIVQDYRNVQKDLYNALKEEFEAEIDPAAPSEWKAALIEDTLVIRFQDADVNFQRGSSAIPAKFKGILNDMIPRYIRVLVHEEFKKHIEEIRIEGHTSSEWNDLVTKLEAYILNMRLSQNRTRSVLNHILGMRSRAVVSNREWIQSKLTANGLSSSKLLDRNGKLLSEPAEEEPPAEEASQRSSETARQIKEDLAAQMERLLADRARRQPADAVREEDRVKSRRVEFRVKLKQEKVLQMIEEASNNYNSNEEIGD